MQEPMAPLDMEGLDAWQWPAEVTAQKLKREMDRWKKATVLAALTGDAEGCAMAALRLAMCELAAAPKIDDKLLREFVKCLQKVGGKAVVKQDRKSALLKLQERKPAERVS
jgi:hypothetical protein